MRRRAFIAALGGVAAWPVLARAQQPSKVARIGYLLTAPLGSPEGRENLNAFRQGLREHGYVEGQNILIEYRTADGKTERYPGLATELARLNLDLIVVGSTSSALAVQQAAPTVPLVVQVMGDPIRDGLVASLARPGRNITGLTFLGPELVTKRLDLLKQALPNTGNGGFEICALLRGEIGHLFRPRKPRDLQDRACRRRRGLHHRGNVASIAS
jgi:putative ABC transport system substrate-binding protein